MKKFVVAVATVGLLITLGLIGHVDGKVTAQEIGPGPMSGGGVIVAQQPGPGPLVISGAYYDIQIGPGPI